MPRTKQKHLKKAVPVAGVVGVSMALAGGSSATGAVGPTPDVPLWNTAPGPQVTFIEEEIFDVSLATFDREGRARTAGHGLRLWRLRLCLWDRFVLSLHTAGAWRPSRSAAASAGAQI